MTEHVVMKEWVTVDLDGDLWIGESTYARDWVVDINTYGYNYQYVRIFTLDAEGNDFEEKQIEPSHLIRVCMKGYRLKLNGYGPMKYAFP